MKLEINTKQPGDMKKRISHQPYPNDKKEIIQ